jgi:hypothetical protein
VIKISFEKAVSDHSRQVITKNNRVYLPATVKKLGFKPGEEVEISFNRQTKEVKLTLLEQ